MNELWTHFHRRININAVQSKIFKAWTTQDGLESWFLRSAAFTQINHDPRNKDEMIQAGDLFCWKWFSFPDYEERGKVIDNNGENLLSFTFNGCKVTVKVYEEEGENICELTQTEIPKEEDWKKNLLVQCGFGWTFYMANLKSILEGGIDLRNKNDNLKDMVNA